MNLKIAPLMLLSLGLTGCGLYVVKRSTPAGDHHGIPFYVKTSGCQRQIVRLKPYYVLTLTTKTGEKTSQSESVAVCRENAASSDLQKLLDAARVGANISAEWTTVKTKLACDPLDQPAATSRNWLVTSDTISAYTYVDYQNPYTLNVHRPIIGSASATTKLATDGTLSEGTAQIEDKTLSTVLGMIPSADLIKAAAGVKGFAVLAPYELKTEQKGVKFTWTYHDPATHSNCETDDDLVSDPPNVGKADLVVEDAGGDKKATDDSNTVKVNGTIELPKAKDATPPAK